MSDTRRKFVSKSSSSGSVDNAVIEKIDSILKQQPVDLEELQQFCSKGFTQQLIQAWSYSSHVNEHARFTSLTSSLSKLVKIFNENAPEFIDVGVQLIKEILTGNQKTLYRALSSMRASLTNPVLRLINEIILFQNGALLDDFVALFDFQLAVLPKLLIPTKQESSNVAETRIKEYLSIRYCFIRVLINLLKYSTPLLRKDWLSNNGKIISNWIKYTSVIDSDGVIDLCLQVWDEKILKEASFKKLTKLKVFNEWNLQKLVPLYYCGNEEIRQNLNKFILSLSIDSKYGLKFASDESWFQSGNGSANGSTIVVNKKTFKTHNKLLYGLLTSLKPWDDELQLSTTVEILSNTQELIPPFLNYLASRGLHDPKLTSYWLGQTLLLSKIIRLPVPEDILNSEGTTAPSIQIISELIVPSVLNRNVLIKCLQSDSFLIRQLSLNLIIDSLSKLTKFSELYNIKGWKEARIDLINNVYHNLPELSNVVACLNDSYSKNKDNKILLIALLMVINGYSGLFNDNFNFSQAISKPYLDTINKKDFQSIDLVLLDNFFQLQEGESSQIKWWNSTQTESSLFTSLLKIASSSSSSISRKITNLLISLLKQTVVFNYEQVKIDPVTILIHSLSVIVSDISDDQLSKIWKLLDESISRCVKTPFKYLDQSNTLGRISPFVLTLFEQWKFVDKKTSFDQASKWFVLFLRYSIIIGEPAESILKLVEESELDYDFSKLLFSSDFESTIHNITASRDCTNQFFELVTTSSFSEILNSNDIPVSDFDVIGSLARIESIISCESISFKDSEAVISNLLSKVGNYWFTHQSSSIKFSSKLYWGSLFLKYHGDKANFVSGIIAEIFQQLDDFDKRDFATVVESRLKDTQDLDEELVLSGALWALDDEVVRSIISFDSLTLKSSAFAILLERKLTISSDEITRSLLYPELHGVISHFIENDLVVFGDLTSLFESVVSTNALSLIGPLTSNKTVLPSFIEFVSSKNNLELITYTVSTLKTGDVDILENKASLSTLTVIAKTRALNLIEVEDFSGISFDQLLHIFTNQLVDLSEDERKTILDYSLTKPSNKYTSEIVQLVQSIGSEELLVKTWINKSILYLTKILAEYPTPSEGFWSFVTSFRSFLTSSELGFKVFNKSNLNALIEVIFTKWIKNETILELASVIVTIAPKNLLEFGKLLQILISNEDNVLLKIHSSSPRSRFLTSLIIWRLFELDVSKNSNRSLQERILTFYNGSTRAEDILLYQVLEKLESRLNYSWIDQVYSWEFMEVLNEDEEDLVGEIKLIEKKKEGFVVVLNKKYVLNGLRNYNVDRSDLSNLGSKSSNIGNWKTVEGFYKKVQLTTDDDISATVYDPLFLSLLVINNDELISTTTTTINDEAEEDNQKTSLEVKVHMKKLLEAELFSAILMNLSSTNQQLQKITIQILSTILFSLKQESESFKDKQVFILFLSKILHTFTKQTTEDEVSQPPLVITLITRLVPILSNPGHNLYEKAFRWILKAPFIKPYEFPLFHEISSFNHLEKSEETDVYHRQLTWFIEGILEGVKTKQDVDFLKKKNLFEWMFNLLNNKYISLKLKLDVLNVLEKIIKIEEGLEVLVSRFGTLAFIEQKVSELKTEILESKDKKREEQSIEDLTRLQDLINLKELSLEIGIVGSQKKRVRDWTNSDLEGFVKRVATI